ncbi:PREDICTED: probable S-adenosylmethionine-dependent methyltransferase At5g38780 [Ipomoea nil]|uniref:probable S-adenosylmethionine-dependent methyltransferase At5g38780 n=1 Tax=Ipomoea nil TaxID=35883 RepID=UPI0009017625|nr:PREDICTED: probable S-adenosylmethionine-dependent methyltransferase At5g38780 [Ipomoea nil]
MDHKMTNENACKIHMNGGDGPESYTKSSKYQKQLMNYSKQITIELIEQQLDVKSSCFDPSKPFRMADFGCSMGPNTFMAVQYITEAVQQKYCKKWQEESGMIPEFHIFFNDLAENDFNVLFRNMPTNCPRHFTAGVPGSFHGRLFPKGSLHLAHCSCALMYLSRLPKEIVDKNSPAWNKGRIHYSTPGAAKEVKEAYSGQFRQDVLTFLDARGDELVPGGLMVIIIVGIPDGVLPSESSISMNIAILGSCLQDMVNMARIPEEDFDSFNLPIYHTSPTEFEALIKENGLFDIIKSERLPNPFTKETAADVERGILSTRAVFQALIEDHFGKDIIEDFFKLYSKKLAANPMLFHEKYRQEGSYFVFLKRKIAD